MLARMREEALINPVGIVNYFNHFGSNLAGFIKVKDGVSLTQEQCASGILSNLIKKSTLPNTV